jgi:hypothetical protein
LLIDWNHKQIPLTDHEDILQSFFVSPTRKISAALAAPTARWS